jgi:hypothetical protein
MGVKERVNLRGQSSPLGARGEVTLTCTSSSDLTRLDASCSDSEPRLEQSESISSIKMVLGA